MVGRKLGLQGGAVGSECLLAALTIENAAGRGGLGNGHALEIGQRQVVALTVEGGRIEYPKGAVVGIGAGKIQQTVGTIDENIVDGRLEAVGQQVTGALGKRVETEKRKLI